MKYYDNRQQKKGAMNRQVIAVLTLVSFIIFSVSCYSVREG